MICEDSVSHDLSPERYKEILNFEMDSEALEYYPVYTIRSPKGDRMKRQRMRFGSGEVAGVGLEIRTGV
jgi:hypothetical protein